MQEQVIVGAAYTDGDIADLNQKLIKAIVDSAKVHIAINGSMFRMVTSIEYEPFGDENFAEKILIKGLRIARISSFNQHKKSVRDYEGIVKSITSEADRIILNQSGVIELFNHSKQLNDIHADENTALSNQDWGRNMNQGFEDLEVYLDEIDLIILSIEKKCDFISQLHGYSPLLLPKS